MVLTHELVVRGCISLEQYRIPNKWIRLLMVVLLALISLPSLADDTTLYAVDDFSAYAIGSNGSPNWQPQSGTWRVVYDGSNKVYEQADPGAIPGYCRFAQSVSALNYSVEVKVRTTQPGPANYDVAALHIGVGGNECSFRMDKDNTGYFIVPGATAYVFTPDPTQWHTWKFIVRSFATTSRVELWLDGHLAACSSVAGTVTGQIAFKPRASKAQFDDFKVTYLWDKDISISLAGNPSPDGYLLSPEELPIVFNASGSLSTTQAQALANRKIKYSITDLGGSVVSSGEYDVTGNTFNQTLTTFDTTTYGHYTLKVGFWSGTRELFSKILPFCVTPYLALDYDRIDNTSPFSVLSTWDDAIMRQIGMKGIVQMLHHPYIAPNCSDTYNWSYIRPNDGYNGKMFSLVNDSWVECPNAALEAAVSKLVELFPDKPTRIYSVMGEVDDEMLDPTKGPTWVVSNYASAYPRIKASDPNSMVIGPEIADMTRAVDHMQKLFDTGFANYVDQISLHAYGSDADPEALFENVILPIQNMAQAHGKPADMWLSEQGIQSSLLGFKQHAENNARRWLYALSLPAWAYTEFVLTDIVIYPSWGGAMPYTTGHFLNNGNANPSTVDPIPWESKPWYPKPSALAHQTTAHKTEGMSFLSRQKIPNGSNNIYKVTFQKPYRKLIALWSVPSSSSTNLTLEGPYTITDLYGNLVQSSPTGGSVSVSTSTSPKFVDVLTILNRDAVTHPADPGVFFSDDFDSYLEGERLDSPFIPGPWTVINQASGVPDWTAKSRSLRKEKTTQSGAIFAGDESWTDYSFELTARTVLPSRGQHTSTTQNVALRFRHTEAEGGYLLRITNDQYVELYGRAGLLARGVTSHHPNDRHTLGISCFGDRITVYIDGAVWRSLIDPAPYTHGRVGIEVPYDTTAVIDNIKVGEARVEAPVFVPDSGTFASDVAVRINCATAGATIRYTTDGRDPTEDDLLIYPGSSVVIDRSTTLKARAYLGALGSAVRSGAYIIGDPQAVYVKKDAPGPVHDGLSWQTAYQSVGAAINAASPGSEIWVAASTYTERIILREGVCLYGGFSGAESRRWQRNPRANVTILDGNAGGPVVTAPAGITQAARLDGFTIRNGSGDPAYGGGGIYCSQSSPVIENCIITGNTVTTTGGGISCYGGAPIIINNIVAGNRAANGGGIYLHQSAATITNNTITANTGTTRGGGLYTSVSGATISNNVIAFCNSGIYNNPPSPTLRSNCLYGNPNYNYAGISKGQDDIFIDPQFINRTAGDYHLASGSGCIDKGWSDAPSTSSTDFDGEGRVYLSSIDIGADEYWPTVDIMDAKAVQDGNLVNVQDMVVSAAFIDAFYIEKDDRSGGIRVERPGHTITVGTRVNVTGLLKTKAGERYIQASSVLPCGY